MSPQHTRTVLAAAHHRFLWVHPFSDGNGRVVRLLTEAMAIQLGLAGRHLYSMARGLARRRQDYDRMLARADLPRQGDLDGRGNPTHCGRTPVVWRLSREGLRDFTTFFRDHRRSNWVYGKSPDAFRIRDGCLAVAVSFGDDAPGDIQKAAGVERRQATKIAARLLDLGLIQSASPRGILRLRMNRALSQALLPEFFDRLQGLPARVRIGLPVNSRNALVTRVDYT